MKKRILHLLASNSYSGAENVVCTIINNCSDEYEMYYCCPIGSIEHVLDEKGINYIPLKRLSIREVRKVIKEYKIDIVHAHDYKASLVSFFLKEKVISQIHCDYKLLWCSFVVEKVYSFIQRKFDRIIVVSREILDNASFKDKIIDKTVVINNVIDSEIVKNKSLEIETDEYDLIFVGRLIHVKQPLLFIDIVNELHRNNCNIKACIVGDGELYDECNKYIQKLNLENNIDLVGFKSNPFPYMKNSKILVMPSLYEGLGLVAIESMILGTIVVSSGEGGLKSIFKNYPKYICHNKDEYITQIEELMNKDKINYQNDCKKMIQDFVDIKKYKKSFVKVYEDVLK